MSTPVASGDFDRTLMWIALELEEENCQYEDSSRVRIVVRYTEVGEVHGHWAGVKKGSTGVDA